MRVFFSRDTVVYMLGDLNSKVGKSGDFIMNDSILTVLLTKLLLQTRLNGEAQWTMWSGIWLRDLCKAKRLRISNGRVFKKADKMTCFKANGESLTEHVLSFECKFSTVLDMNVFNWILMNLLFMHAFGKT